MKKIKIISPYFSPHKVTIKSTLAWSNPPSYALSYILDHYEGVMVTVLKQRVARITIEIHCTDVMYDLIKLNFVKDMGRNYLWKD